MHVRRTVAAAGLVAAALMPVTAANAADPSLPVAAPGTPAPAPSTLTVPLPTGDTVTVERSGAEIRSTTVTAAPGRGDVTFTIDSFGSDDVRVVPEDAEPLLAAGRIDPRLFDVKALLEAGYGTKGTTADRAVGMIVQHAKGSGAAEKARAAVGGVARPGRTIPRLGLTALDPHGRADAATTWKRLTAGTGRSLAGGAGKLWLDGRMHVALDTSVPQINAPQAWSDGYTGKGVTVAVLDTGFDSDHPDLAGRVTVSSNFVGGDSAEDDNGHGTHVASTIAGTDATYRGVAPDASLAVGKVCDSTGSCTTSAVLAGIDWAVNTAHADIVNMSLGGPADETDPAIAVINDLSASTGTLFVVAAGNDGEFGTGTVGAPAIANSALAVGAVDSHDELAPFSSRGPRPSDNAVKPDITAPGVDIVAAKAGGGHTSKSGTSMATPHVAGSAALVAQAHPDWSGEQIKTALMNSAEPNPKRSPFQQGTGRVDAGRAAGQTVLASPANLTTTADWSAGAGKDTEHTVTFTNSADTATTLALALERPMSPTAQPGNAEQFSVDRDEVTVPAHSTATANVTTRATTLPHGPWSAVLVASHDGKPVTRTILGVDSPVPTHLVTLHAEQRDGTAATGSAMMVNRWTGDRYPVRMTAGTGSVTVPEAQYWIGMSIISGSGTERSTTMAAASVTPVADTAVDLDARTAVPVGADVHDPKARATAVQAALAVPAGTGTYTLSVVTTGQRAGQSLYATPFDDADAKYRTFAVFAAEGASSAAPSPFFYHVARTWTHGVPDRPAFSVARRDLTDVSVHFDAQGVPAAGTGGATPDDDVLLPLFIDQSVRFPSTVRDFRTAGEWLDRATVAGRQSLATSAQTFGPHALRRLDFAAAVVGPALPAAPAYRVGDTVVWAGTPWFADGDGTRGGTDWGASGTLVLAADGRKVSEWSAVGSAKSITVPAGPARYTLGADITRDQPYAALSTRVRAEWTFASDTDAGAGTLLPLMAVRFTPYGLDASGGASRFATTRVDVQVQRAPGAVEATVGPVRLEVSWDDGATWRPAGLTSGHHGAPAHADLTAPPGASYATLRATVAASDGSTVEQTVTRAFQVNKSRR
ncbi:S8 family serine peptidase [Streptomyces sp. NBC_00102]|uniref:S8 family peptidase n=1 Tax=Streptomyces sp. NBC_00102 TaxID=2975652 RepID=UPI00224E01E5|nr:S8 family serine peptidase [Streptomyces sp. NBC_00102]MCX5400713.1 S8 family serine peptidase [Streptomyces sp. NBC_00102]